MTFAAKSMNRVGPSAHDDTRMRPLDWLMVAILTVPIFGTFFPVGTYLAGSVNAGGQVADASRDTTMVLAAILLFILYQFAKSMPHSLAALARNWPIFLFVLWALISSRWAEIPSYSFNRSGRLLIGALYGVCLVELIRMDRAKRIIFYAIGISLACSLMTIIAVPSLAATSDGRGFLKTWRGAMSHKNSLGLLAGLGFLYGFIMYGAGYVRKPLCIALMMAALILILLANSVTALLATLLVFGILFYFFTGVKVVKDRVLLVAAGLVLAVTAGLVIMSLGSVLYLFGRDSTLTGRSDVWKFAYLMIEQKPFWGYGHGAWGMPVFQAKSLAALRWPCPHAHNFWIDLRVQLGIPGLTIAICIWAMISYNIVKGMLSRSFQDIAFPLAIFILFCIRSYSETIIVDPDTGAMFWLAFCYASFARVNLKQPALHYSALAMSRKNEASFRHFGVKT